MRSVFKSVQKCNAANRPDERVDYRLVYNSIALNFGANCNKAPKYSINAHYWCICSEGIPSVQNLTPSGVRQALDSPIDSPCGFLSVLLAQNLLTLLPNPIDETGWHGAIRLLI
jgi:hypothetical protein